MEEGGREGGSREEEKERRKEGRSEIEPGVFKTPKTGYSKRLRGRVWSEN